MCSSDLEGAVIRYGYDAFGHLVTVTDATGAVTRYAYDAGHRLTDVTLPDGTMLYDSGLIIEALGARFGVDLDGHLDARARARGHAVRRLVEEHLYFVGAWERWVPPEARAITVRDYFAYLPPGIRVVAGWVAGRAIHRNLHGQGVGRLTPDQIRAAGRADLAALASLCEGPFFLGEPSSVDATVLAFLWAIGAHPIRTALAVALADEPVLVEYVARAKARWWPDAEAIAGSPR